MTPSWLLDLLAALMLVVAAASVVQVSGTPSPDVGVAQAVMAVAMAGMFAPGLATLPDAAWEVIFGLMTGWFACRAWGGTRGARALLAGRGALHVLHCAAMLYMSLGVRHPTLAAAFAALLIGYSVWDLDQLPGKRHGPAAGSDVTLGLSMAFLMVIML
jgi:hypothetical protein